MKKAIQVLVLSVCAMTSVFSESQAQSNEPYRISGEMVPLGDVTKYEVSPDGKYVVYIADQDLDNLPQLYSVPISGGTPTRLSEAAFIFVFPVFDFKISQDSKHVVFTQDLNISTLDPQGPPANVRMVSVPIAGGDNIDLSEGAANDTREVSRFSISSDSQRVVYISDKDTDGVYELYSSLITGGTLTKLNTNLPIGGQVISFNISTDNQRVVYRSDQNIDNTFELYSVPITGGMPAKLNGALVSGGDVHVYKISPDSARVVYRADQEFDNKFELYSVPLVGGGSVVRLNPFSSNSIQGFDISMDSQQVVYRRTTSGVPQLFSVPIAGGRSVKLNANLVGLGGVTSFQITPNSQQVVYQADQEVDNIQELYRVSITGGDVEKLSRSLNDQGLVWNFKISPDSQRVLYVLFLEVGSVASFQLFSVSINGDTPLALSGDSRTFRISEYQISSDSQMVIFLSTQDQGGVELYHTGISGGG